jgi:hypothetical protein
MVSPFQPPNEGEEEVIRRSTPQKIPDASTKNENPTLVYRKE